jgi:hypothetical protein
VPYTLGEIAALTGLSPASVAPILEWFERLGMVEVREDGAYRCTHFQDRQYGSDSSTERVRRHRARQRAESAGRDQGAPEKDAEDPRGGANSGVGAVAPHNISATLPKRCSNEPETETDPETEEGENSGDDAPVSEPSPRARSYLGDCARSAQARGNGRSWTVPEDAGGFDPFEEGPLKSFCALIRMPFEQLPDKTRDDWSRQLRNIGRSSDVTAEVVEQAIRALPSSEYSWMTPTSPYQESFAAAIGVLVGRIKAGMPLSARKQVTSAPEQHRSRVAQFRELLRRETTSGNA